MAKALGLEPIKDFDAHNLNRGPASGVCLFPLPTPPPQKKSYKVSFYYWKLQIRWNQFGKLIPEDFLSNWNRFLCGHHWESHI